MEEKTWLVYCHTNKSNGKMYIGITGQKPEWRWGKNGNLYLRYNNIFAHAIKKYGWDGFEHNILEKGLSPNDAKEKEKYYIDKYRTYVGFKDSNGYNATLGGDGCFGVIRSKEARLKCSISQMGEKNHMYGKKASPETRKLLSEQRKGGNNSSAKVVIYKNEIYDCAKDFCKKYNLVDTTVRAWLNGNTGMPLFWYENNLRYLGEEDNVFLSPYVVWCKELNMLFNTNKECSEYIITNFGIKIGQDTISNIKNKRLKQTCAKGYHFLNYNDYLYLV